MCRIAQCLWIVMACAAAWAHPPVETNQPLARIAFGSCNRQDRPQDYWHTIAAAKPDLWIWLGDNIYADTEDIGAMRSMYQAQFAAPPYAAFREQVPIIGTWDDHDFGANNSGSWYPKRAESQQELLDFLEVPRKHPRRRREGVYGAYTFGPAGRRVDVILLDGRYHAERPGPEASLLGEAQWGFLEAALSNTTAELTLVCSGIQVIAEDHPYELWNRYPRERERLFKLLRATRAPGVILLSGDRHIHEISVLNDERVRYPLIDVTSSGLTHSYAGLQTEKNRYRVGPKSTQKGFGLIEIDWKNQAVSIQIRNIDGTMQNRIDLPLKTLRPSKDAP